MKASVPDNSFQLYFADQLNLISNSVEAIEDLTRIVDQNQEKASVIVYSIYEKLKMVSISNDSRTGRPACV